MKFSQWLSQCLVHLVRILITLLILSIFLGIVYFSLRHLSSQASLSKATNPIEEEVTAPAVTDSVEVSLQGDVSVKTAADTLLKKGLIKDKNSFIQVASQMGLYNYFTPGDYSIPKDAKVKEMIEILTADKLEELKDTTVTLPAQVTTEQVADILYSQDLIASKPAFVAAVNKMGVQGQFKAGKHQVNPPIKVDELIKLLCQEGQQ